MVTNGNSDIQDKKESQKMGFFKEKYTKYITLFSQEGMYQGL